MKKTNNIEKYVIKKYLFKRLIRLLIPYVVLQLVIILPKFLIGKVSNKNYDLFFLEIIKFSYLPREEILPHLWFLPTLMIFSTLTSSLIKINSNKIWKIVILIG